MRIFLIVILILLIAVYGCDIIIYGNEAQGTPREIDQKSLTESGTTEIEMTVSHTSYEQNLINAKLGDKIIIKAVAAKGTSAHNHGITIDEYSINKAVITEDKENPSIIEFMADKEGEFRIYCKTCWDGPFGRNHPDIEGKLVVR